MLIDAIALFTDNDWLILPQFIAPCLVSAIMMPPTLSELEALLVKNFETQRFL